MIYFLVPTLSAQTPRTWREDRDEKKSMFEWRKFEIYKIKINIETMSRLSMELQK